MVPFPAETPSNAALRAWRNFAHLWKRSTSQKNDDIMDRHFQCDCGGTGWVDREDGQMRIHCEKCGATVYGNSLTECRTEWRALNKSVEPPEAGKSKRSGRR